MTKIYKVFYLILGLGLLGGAAYLAYKRTIGTGDMNATYSIYLCGIVGALCMLLFFTIDKLQSRDS
jgi:hypothetical protein